MNDKSCRGATERLTDRRFLGEGYYQPKTKLEYKQICMMRKPTYEEIYKRLGEYENTGLSPDEINRQIAKWGVND